MTTFVVAGHAAILAPADRGTVHVAIGVTDDDSAAASREAFASHNAVIAEADAHAASGAARTWNAESVSTGTWQEWVKDTAVTRFRASSRVDVEFTDFDALAEWLADLAERPNVSIDGVDWALTTERHAELLRDVRIQAVRDAVTKAADYAAALQRGKPVLDAVFEEGLRPGLAGGGGGVSLARAVMKAADNGETSTAPELKPHDLEVSASITADFTM